MGNRGEVKYLKLLINYLLLLPFNYFTLPNLFPLFDTKDVGMALAAHGMKNLYAFPNLFILNYNYLHV